MKWSSCDSAPPVCNSLSNATHWLSFVTPFAVKYKLKDRFQCFHCTTKFVGSSVGLKQGSPLTSVINKLPEVDACSPLDELSWFDDLTISKRMLRIYKTLKITFPNGDKNLYPRRQCNIPVWLSTQRVLLALDLNKPQNKTNDLSTSHVYPRLRELSLRYFSSRAVTRTLLRREALKGSKIAKAL